jgi:hypothetical protein
MPVLLLLPDPKGDRDFTSLVEPRGSESCTDDLLVTRLVAGTGGWGMHADNALFGSKNPFRSNRRRSPIGLMLVIGILFLSSPLARAVQPGSAKPFRVIDRNGALVGYTVTENLVARQIGGNGGNWVTFYVHTGLGIFDSNAIYVYYTTSDCSGTQYLPKYSTFAEGTRVGPTLYYPTDQQVLNPQSLHVVYGSGEVGSCLATSDIAGVYGAAATVTVDSFGLVLPFKAVQ